MRFADTTMSKTTTIIDTKKDMIERILTDAKDKDVACVVVYANESDELFYDKTTKEKVKPEDVFDLFVKGMLVVKDDVYYKPTNCKKDGTITFKTN